MKTPAIPTLLLALFWTTLLLASPAWGASPASAQKRYSVPAGNAMRFARDKAFAFRAKALTKGSVCRLGLHRVDDDEPEKKLAPGAGADEGYFIIEMRARKRPGGSLCDFALFQGRKLKAGWRVWSGTVTGQMADCGGWLPALAMNRGTRNLGVTIRVRSCEGRDISAFMQNISLEGPEGSRSWREAFE